MTDHYFSSSPDSKLREHTIAAVLGGVKRQLTTATGVFSHEHLDTGTQVLLEELPSLLSALEVPAGAVLDLGCGWGPIALDAALTGSAPVYAVDVNERSLYLTAKNATALGVGEQVIAALPGDVPAAVQFAEIRSNPPIRIGKQELHALLLQWLPRLLPGGVAHLVVAKQLGAESLLRWLRTELPNFSCSRAARDKGFHILQLVRES